jgi:hypothetical protein
MRRPVVERENGVGRIQKNFKTEELRYVSNRARRVQRDSLGSILTSERRANKCVPAGQPEHACCSSIPAPLKNMPAWLPCAEIALQLKHSSAGSAHEITI